MNRRFIILPRAAQDLREQRDYIAQDSVRAGERFLTAAEQAFARLSEMPGMGAMRPVRNPRIARRTFKGHAVRWLTFVGRLHLPAAVPHPYAGEVAQFADYLRRER